MQPKTNQAEEEQARRLQAVEENRVREEQYQQKVKAAKLRQATQERKNRPVRQLLDIVGSPSSVSQDGDYTGVTETTSSERKRDGKTFRVEIARDASMLDVVRVAATEMFHTNVAIIDKVTSTLDKPHVGSIARSIEKARVELLGDIWFSSKMALDTKDKLEIRNNENVSRGLRASHNSYIGGAIEKVIYSLGGYIDEDKVRHAMEHFDVDIRAATMSMDSTAAINVAVDIAYYLDMPDGEEEEEAGDEPGEGESDGTGNEPGAGAGDSEHEGTPEEKSEDAPEGEVPPSPSGADSSNGTDTPTTTLTHEAPPEVEKVSPEELKKRLNRNVRAGVTRRATAAKNMASSGRAGQVETLSNGQADKDALYYDAHNAVRVTVGSVPTPVSEPIKMALKTYADNHAIQESLLHKRGAPSRHAWKMNYGNMRVFQKPPKTKGHVSILIDISSSMGCWCVGCNKAAFGLAETDEYRSRRRVSNAFLAWQVSAALGRLHPTAEVFAFSSPVHNIGGGMQTAIYPLPAGHQPSACGNDDANIQCGGTPTCAAMLWFKDHLSQRAAETTAVIITDGNPNGCGPRGATNHVEVIGANMIASGMKFGTVFIGNGQYLSLPTEVSMNVSQLSDLRNIQPLLQLLDE